MKKLLIFDGNSIINRAFYGVRLLTNSKGQYTNGVYGFLNIFLKFLEEENPDYLAVAFDLKAPTFRHKQYEGYKAKRKGMPEELASQMPLLKQILNNMNVACLEAEGYEADDIIGTVSYNCEKMEMQCVIITGDKDDLQLASDTTTVRLVVTKGGNTETTNYDSGKVYETFGVTPEEFISVKALMGDPSDNIPGVAGIGEKTAFSLIQRYKSLDDLYENIPQLKGSQKTKIEQGKEMAYLSYDLSKIKRDVPLSLSIDDMKVREFQEDALYQTLSDLELKTLIARLGLKQKAPVSFASERKEITSCKELEQFSESKLFYLTELEDGQLKRFSYLENGKVKYIDFFTEFDVSEYQDAFLKLFGNEQIEKISHDIKKDIVFFKEVYGIDFQGSIFDVKICAYLEQPSNADYPMEDLAKEYTGILQIAHGCEVAVLPQIMEAQKQHIEENGQKFLLYDVEFPLVKVLASMEMEGFQVDKEKLSEFSKELAVVIDRLQGEIYQQAGEEFNINSPKQLGSILFDKLHLPVVKKTKTGYSTNVEVLEKLEGKHEIVKNIMEYRTYTKLKSTYADGLYHVINPTTGKIHSSFNQTITATGRISSTEPNLQNIPVRLELGRNIRKMFIASGEDKILVDADYSQIELRVLAHISQDDNMIQAFRQNKDIHTITASQVFGVPEEEVTSQMRTRAKAVNFGIVYGIGEFSLAKDISVTRKVAAEYIQSYFLKYPKIKEYMDNTVEFAKQNGYVTTALGRRRYIPEMKSSNYNLRAFGERIAMNAPIQGYAADIIKIAMVRVFQRLQKAKLKSKLILQVHDELIIDAYQEEVEQVKSILKHEMEHAVTLDVPLVVDMKTGKSWYDTK